MGREITEEVYTNEELASAITHGIGVLLCLVGVPILLGLATKEGTWFQLLGLSIFSFSLLLVYATSTIYHSIAIPRWKSKLQIADHISIYFLIAGTHTPFLLYYLNNSTGHFYLFLLWFLVLIGLIYKLFFFGKFRIFSVLFYLALGWMAVFTIPPMLGDMRNECLQWIIIGGAFYTSGVLFYLWESLPYHHAIWHLFVIGGSLGHYIALLYVV